MYHRPSQTTNKALACAVLILLSGCASIPTDLGSLPDLLGRPAAGHSAPRSYNLFSDQADHVKELLDAGQPERAASIYDEHFDTFFNQNEVKHAQLARRLAEEFDKAHAARFEHITAQLSQLKPGKADWREARAAFASAEKLSKDFSFGPAARGGKRIEPNYAAFLSKVEIARAEWTKVAPEAFVAFDHTRDFFAEYPVTIENPAALLDQNASSIAQKLQGKGKDGILAFYRTYKSLMQPATGSKPSATMAEVSNLYVQHVLSRQPGVTRLKAAFAALAEAKAAGLTPTEVPSLKIAFVDATSKTLLKDGQIEFPVAIDVDIPFSVTKTTLDALLAGSDASSDYVVVLDVAVANTRQKVAKRDEIASTYLSGSRQVPNPAYEPARMAVYQAQSAYNQNQAQFCQGMGCIGKGIAGIALAAKLGDVRKEFESTPMTLTEPVYTDYRFHASDLIASRTVTANYYIIERRLGTYFKSSFDLAEEKQFRMAYNLHEKDRDRTTYLQTHSTESDVKQFNESPATIKLSAVLEQFINSQVPSQPLKSFASLRTDLVGDKNRVLTAHTEKARKQGSSIKEDARFESVVVVRNPKGSLGAGFFVAPDLVLTNYHVIEGATFIEMKMHNGLDTFGKVIRSDVRLDLALVKVQTRGTPVTFYEGQVPLGATVEAIGHPRGLEFSITRGVVSAVRKMPGIMNVGGKDVTFIQTDTPINPGNSGGPLFFNGQVIGVNDFKLSRSGIEGISFSIHYTEAQDFLKESK